MTTKEVVRQAVTELLDVRACRLYIGHDRSGDLDVSERRCVRT